MKRPRFAPLVGGLLALLLALAWLALSWSTVPTPPAEVLAALTGNGEGLVKKLVLEFRLPRMLLATLGGAMFAVSGTLLQASVRNPLASPDIVGVGAGAGLAITLLLMLWPSAADWLLPWSGFLGAWAAFLLVMLLAKSGGGLPPVRVALLGVAVGAACAALSQVALLRGPDHIAPALAFLSGTVYAADMARVFRLLPWAALLLPLALALHRRLDVLSLSEDVALSLGESVSKSRTLCLTVGVGLAAAAVSACGVLGFVGLIAPHAARMLAGGLHRQHLLASALLGAVLVLGADIFGRLILPPTEIPVGLLTTLLGAPYFLHLLRGRARPF